MDGLSSSCSRDDGLVGIGNAALAPHVTKQVIDLYLKPLLHGRRSLGHRILWQHMYRKTMAFGRKGIGMVAISAVDIALWDLLGKSAKQPVYRLLGGRTKPRIPVYASRLYSSRSTSLRRSRAVQGRGLQGDEAALRLGTDRRRRGHAAQRDLVRTVRETVGDGIDVMADAYMGWTLDYAKRMLPLLEPFNLRWLEEPVIPDDIHGYAELKSSAASRLPAANTNSRCTASANCSRPARSTTSSSTPTASAASRRRERSPRLPKLIPSRSSLTPDKCTTITS